MLVVGKGRVSFAPGVSFNDMLHEYHYKGKQLSGVTRKICERMKLNFKDAENQVIERCDEGSQVHAWIQEYLDTGIMTTVHSKALWVKQELCRRYSASDVKAVAMSEVLVSDFGKYASAVDIIVEHDGIYDLFDVKTGKFKPEYLAWQLGIYKTWLEMQGKTVGKCYCICTKDEMFYKVLPRNAEDVKALLYGDRNWTDTQD